MKPIGVYSDTYADVTVESEVKNLNWKLVTKDESQSVKLYLQKITHQIGQKKFKKF